MLAACLLAGSCKDDVDYVKVVLRSSDPSLAISPLDLRVSVVGSGKSSSFGYVARQKIPGAESPPDLSEFTVSFGPEAGDEVDIIVRTRPNDSVDWGGDSRVRLPGAGRTVSIGLTRGETALQNVATLDGDIQSAAAYGGQLVLAWPTVSGKVSLLSINPDRGIGLERPPEFGAAASKIRVASRPSSDFTSELFAASWLERGATPVLKTETRTQTYVPRSIGTVSRATDVHAACARRDLTTTPIVTAVLTDAGVVVHTHDETGATLAGPFTNPALQRVNRIVGLAVTPNETVTLALNGNGSWLVQMSTQTGAVIHEERLTGIAMSMSPSADGSRLLVASVMGINDEATLQLETFSVQRPTRIGAPSVVDRFPLIPGVVTSRVSLSTCAMAWPVIRSDGSGVTDVRFQELDIDGRPAGESHLANIGRDGQHFAPTAVCLSSTRAFLTFFDSANPTGPTGRLSLRRMPTLLELR